MESETFLIRVSKLIQKSRKAVRLYSSQGRSAGEYTEYQFAEWREISSILLQGLASAMELPSNKRIVTEIFALRDRFYSMYHSAEIDMRLLKKELNHAVESDQFAKAANLSIRLISLKARVQAAQSAHHELQELIENSHVVQPTIELTHTEVTEAPAKQVAKVIPLRRRSAGNQ